MGEGCPNGNRFAQPRGPDGRVIRGAISPDGRRAVVGGFGGLHRPGGADECCVHLYDITTGRELHRMKGHSAPVGSARFSPDGSLVVSCSSDQTARIWEIESGRQISKFEVQSPNGVYDGVFLPDGKSVLTGGLDGTIRHWDVQTGKERRAIVTGHRMITRVAVDKTGRFALACAAASVQRMDQGVERTISCVCLLDLDKGTEVRTFQGHSEIVLAACFSGDARRVASSARDGTVRVWDVLNGKEIVKYQSRERVVADVVIGSDGRTIHVLTGSGQHQSFSMPR